MSDSASSCQSLSAMSWFHMGLAPSLGWRSCDLGSRSTKGLNFFEARRSALSSSLERSQASIEVDDLCHLLVRARVGQVPQSGERFNSMVRSGWRVGQFVGGGLPPFCRRPHFFALEFPLQSVQLLCCLLLIEGVGDFAQGNQQNHASPFRIRRGRQNFERSRNCGVGVLGGAVEVGGVVGPCHQRLPGVHLPVLLNLLHLLVDTPWVTCGKGS